MIIGRVLTRVIDRRIVQANCFLKANKMKLTFDPKLKEMKQLNRELFRLNLTVPVLKVKKVDYAKAKKILRSYTLETLVKKRHQELEDENDPHYSTHKYLLLDPDVFCVDKLDESTKRELAELLQSDASRDLNTALAETRSINLDYDDLKFDDVMRAILPDSLLNENVNVKGYSMIGHIAHFNLRDKILDYKHIIGQVLLDKIPQIKTVVNKLSEIDSTFRNFQFEILAGVNDTNVTCKENGCEFKFDFAKVYWNPRLSTEHERVVNLLNENDVLYDVFAGVGPFSIPAISRRRLDYVLANDLNPDSFRSLMDNYRHNNKSKLKKRELENKKSAMKGRKLADGPLLAGNFRFDPAENFVGFNLDGREFIRDKVKYHLVELLNYRRLNELKMSKFYALMNLPAMSVEFLDAFVGLYNAQEKEIIQKTLDAKLVDEFELNVFCYHFCKSDEGEYERIKTHIKNDIYSDDTLDIASKYVRKVAPNKDMYCTMFKLKFRHFFAPLIDRASSTSNGVKNKIDQNDDIVEPENKIQKTE